MSYLSFVKNEDCLEIGPISVSMKTHQNTLTVQNCTIGFKIFLHLYLAISIVEGPVNHLPHAQVSNQEGFTSSYR